MADTTLRFDRRKTALHLAGGIHEVWDVDVNAEVVHVPTPAGTRVVTRGESSAPEAVPDLLLEVTDIVG